jgi:hypothetical protein
VYHILRGKDLETGAISVEKRDAQFALLREAQARALDLRHWHQFMSALVGAGFRSAEMVSSQNALLYAYAFYVIGRTQFAVPEHVLQKAIGRWYFFASLTGRYTSSPESTMDSDLNRLGAVGDAQDFVRMLEDLVASELTNDYWSITLPTALDSSSARNPELFAYVAAQNRLNAPVLFSHKKIAELIDPSLRGKRKALERHHLFPRAWLEKQGVTDLKLINQMANQALLEWPDNVAIGDASPQTYVAEIRSRFPASEWKVMLDLHALPVDWEQMGYDVFLEARRRLMADVIRRGFLTLSPT